MAEEFGPDDAAERERQVHNATPEPTGFCEAMNPDGTVRCALSKGHGRAVDGSPPRAEKYDHAAPSLGVWWNNPPRQVPDTTPLDRTPGALRMTVLIPQPVRVRFIELPHRSERRAIPFTGVEVDVSVPGGFALVVDRFGTSSRRDAEQDAWVKFGTDIGARIVLCYPYTLDIEPWMDATA